MRRLRSLSDRERAAVLAALILLASVPDVPDELARAYGRNLGARARRLAERLAEEVATKGGHR